MFRTRTYTHNGFTFCFEADGWLDEFSAGAAINHLHRWLSGFTLAETTELFVALTKESTAIAGENVFDHDCHPYPEVRAAQHRAATAGMLGRVCAGDYPSVTIDACEIAGMN